MASKGRDLGNIVSPQTGIAVTFSGDPVVLGVGNTEHVRVTGAGDIYLGGYLQSSTAHNTLQKIKVAPYNWTGGSTAEIASIEMGAESTGSDDGNIIFKTATNVNSGGTLDEAMRIRYDGNVGIGTDDIPVKLTVVGNVRSGYDPNIGVTLGLSPVGIPTNDANSYILWGDNPSFGGNNGDLIYVPRTSVSASHRFYAGSPTPSEKVRIDSDGLKFNGDTASNNALDDYEEGTWTPKFIDWSDGNDMFVNNGLIIYHATYVKIGEYCWISTYVANDASFNYASGKDGTQNIGIGGLPFTIVGSSAGFYPIHVGYYMSWNGWDSNSYGYMPSGYFYSAYDRIILTYATNNGVGNIPGSLLYSSNSAVLFSGYYKVA